MGYSMGARITAFLAMAHPERVRSAIFGGLGIKLVRRRRPAGNDRATALEAPSLDDVTDPTVAHVPQLSPNRPSRICKALAACIRGSRQTLSARRSAAISVPVLVAVGTKDDVAGSPQELAALIPGRAGAARYPGPRSHAGGRRQGLQGRRAGIP